MPKHKGDIKQSRPMTLGEIGEDFARSLDHRDPRFERFWNFKPFDKYYAPQGQDDTGLVGTKKQVQAAFGSNRSGKSLYCAALTVMVYTGHIPPAFQGRWGFEEKLRAITSGPGKRPRHCRIIVMDYSEHWPVVIEPFLTSPEFGLLPEPWSNFSKSDHIFTGPDGSLLDIWSSDPSEQKEHGERAIRGGRIDLTWIDEINREAAYTESVVRSAAHADSPGLVICSFCPQEGFKCWTFETFFKACFEMHGDRPIRKKPNDCHEYIYSLHVSMKDNPLITPAEYERQKQMYKPWEVAYRVDGWYSNRSDNPYFDIETLLAWELEARYTSGIPYQVLEDKVDPENGIFKGVLSIVAEQDTQPGMTLDEAVFPVWRVWEPPRAGEKYVLSADPSEGNPRSDPLSASVWKCTDKYKPKQVAQLHMVRLKPGEFAVQCACMANVYGNCLLVPECNNDPGGTFTDRVRNYSNLYVRTVLNDQSEEPTTKLGWRTDRFTKGPMLETAYRVLAECAAQKVSLGVSDDGEELSMNWCPFSSRVTLQEFIAYEERLVVKMDGTKKTEWGAKRGATDDCVMEAVIGLRIIRHEYEKISTCKFAPVVASSRPNEHYLGKGNQKDVRPFSRWKKQTSLKVLRKNHGR